MYIMFHTLLDDYNKNYAKKPHTYRKRTHTLGCLKELNKSTENLKALLNAFVEHLDSYYINMDVLLNIKYGEKIGKEDGKYCIFQTGYLQQMTRWWYRENRFKTYDYIRHDLQDIAKYLENYYNNILLSKDFQVLTLNKQNMLYIETAIFNDRLIAFIKRLVTSIYTLKRTYINDYETNYFSTNNSVDKAKEIVALIDFRIQNMLEYKNKFADMFSHSKIKSAQNTEK